MRHGPLRRRWSLALLAGVAAPFVVASAAYACVSLATITMTPGSAEPGQTAEGSGHGFRAGHGGAGDELDSPVEVRWNGRDGEVMWRGRPDIDGTLNFSLTVPDVETGSYMVIAIQQADGTDVSGTPARTSFEVAPSAVAPPAAPALGNTGDVTPPAAPDSPPAVRFAGEGSDATLALALVVVSVLLSLAASAMVLGTRPQRHSLAALRRPSGTGARSKLARTERASASE